MRSQSLAETEKNNQYLSHLKISVKKTGEHLGTGAGKNKGDNIFL